MNNFVDAHKVILSQVTIRLLEESERARFDELLEQEHYLKSARIGGRSLRYVAELNGQWIALLAFSGAAPDLKSREDWIGWSQTRKARRLGFVVNNSLYLLLTDRGNYPEESTHFQSSKGEFAVVRSFRTMPLHNCGRYRYFFIERL